MALDPMTFDVETTWAGPTELDSALITPFFTYSTMYQGRYVTPALGPRIVEIARKNTDNQKYLELAAETGLSAVVGEASQIINSQYDADGNLWFTTGRFPGAGIVSASTIAVVGYVSPSGTIRHLELPNTGVENGVALGGLVLYITTGPAGDNNHTNATSHLYALEPSAEGNGIRVLCKEEYEAGDGIKGGGISRGSGSSPSLLGDEHVVITDKANERINLLFFIQAKGSTEDGVRGPVCKVPLFAVGASANENTLDSQVTTTARRTASSSPIRTTLLQ
ncbi:hypothetical protein PVAG01_10972 [Phlyctema vagabunda]|uniref:Uncharacterized protein n=1 Tax=Phlyctema vagabunda TaxID=108571 RepID=A0ABR4P3R7_9HELO